MKRALSSIFLLFAIGACGRVDDEPVAADNGGSGDGDESSAWTPAAFCASSNTIDRAMFDALTPSPPADYLAMRSLTGGFDEPDGGRKLVTEMERGNRCASASDVASCEQRYDALGLEAIYSRYLFFTRGDDVGIVEKVEEAMALLGTIDSPEEAYFVAGLKGLSASCDADAAAVYRRTDDGFEIVTREAGCLLPTYKVVVRVHSDGTIEETSRVKIGEPGPCP